MEKSSGSKNKKLKIAIIHPDLGIGGAERLIVDTAVQLASHGHSVHLFTAHHDKNRCFEETLAGPFSVKVYGGFLPRHIFYRFHALCAYLRCIFVALCVLLMWPSFDIILADQVSVVIPLLKLKRSTKIFFYCHFPDLLLAQHTTMLRRIYRCPIDMIEEATTGMADLILVNSKFTSSVFATTFSHIHSRGICPAVLYPAVNVEQFDGPCFYKLNFLSINRFERKKNLQLAISAFALLCSFGNSLPSHVKVTLTIAGGYDKRLKENVEYLNELKRLAELEGVSEQVKFVTSCSTAERNELLSQCLAVLYTPKDEHFGIVPLEAMAAKKPVIACNSGGPLETIKHDVTGFLCEPTPSEFSQAMSKLVNDPEIAARMGEAARNHVTEKFSTKTFGEQLNRYVLDIYHHRIETHSTSTYFNGSAENLGLPHISAYLNPIAANFSHGASFATSLATILPQNSTLPLGGYSPFSLDVQLKQFSQFIFRSQVAHKQGGVFGHLMPKEDYFSRALYMFDIGHNDLTALYFQNISAKPYLSSALQQLSTAIKRVYGEGGRSFWIHNTGPLGCLPYVLVEVRRRAAAAAWLDSLGCSIALNELAEQFNAMLNETVNRLRLDLPLATMVVTDIYSVKYSLIRRAGKLGFQPPPLQACCGHGGGTYNFDSGAWCGATTMVDGKRVLLGKSCKNPSKRVIWDGAHYTEAANKWMFDQISGGKFSDPAIPLNTACHKKTPPT
ncbi:hypothetical protein Cni_G23072 [Canna indica]|uniref:Alpha-1,3/1,6-mannosyltransferase ALG2 n=1 Tax=Canna indica TaxID=4628 RepID=A0AAQ3KSG8_9LILI|nr:hypothetical protein Cni_G23072 [Canna indica]